MISKYQTFVSLHVLFLAQLHEIVACSETKVWSCNDPNSYISSTLLPKSDSSGLFYCSLCGRPACWFLVEETKLLFYFCLYWLLSINTILNVWGGFPAKHTTHISSSSVFYSASSDVIYQCFIFLNKQQTWQSHLCWLVESLGYS